MKFDLLLERAYENINVHDRVVKKSDIRCVVQQAVLLLAVAQSDGNTLQSERDAISLIAKSWTLLPEDSITLTIDFVRDVLISEPLEQSTVINIAADYAKEQGQSAALMVLDSAMSIASADGDICELEGKFISELSDAFGLCNEWKNWAQRRNLTAPLETDVVVRLNGGPVTIGRERTSDVHLDSSEVMRCHATLVHRDGVWWIETFELGSVLFVDNTKVMSAPMPLDAVASIGPYRLRVCYDEAGAYVHCWLSQLSSTFTVDGLAVSVPDTNSGGKKAILEDISFTVFAGELVGLIGPSGCGKTTLLDAISSSLKFGDADIDGKVYFNTALFHPQLMMNPNLIGVVPQDDIIHPTLTVSESLYYSARLRLSADLQDDGVMDEVDVVLNRLDIKPLNDDIVGDKRNRGISGGQRKRVNLAQELVAPSMHILFLDEPTSGLDPVGSLGIVGIAKDLARGTSEQPSKIVFLITHDLSERVVEELDQVIILTEHGRLAFFGPPAKACEFYGVDRLDLVIKKVQGPERGNLAEQFRESIYYKQYVTSRKQFVQLNSNENIEDAVDGSAKSKKPLFDQLKFLVRRSSTVKIRDRAGLLVLLAQAPILAVLMVVVFSEVDPSLLFIMSLGSLWFGCSAAVREVISELPILRREIRAGLRLFPYLFSKLVVVVVVCAIQCLMLVGILFVALGMSEYGYSFVALYGVTLLTATVGVTIGILVSCIFESIEAAVGSIPLLLLPQIALGGLIVYVREMGLVANILSCFTVTRWSFDAILLAGDRLVKPGASALERTEVPVSAVRYLLGFKTSTDITSNGMSYMQLCAVLAVMATLCFLMALMILKKKEWR